MAIFVARYSNESHYYIANGVASAPVRKVSSAHQYDDFVYSDSTGTTIPEGTLMPSFYKSTKIIVTVNNEQMQPFASEEDAIQWITAQWSKQPSLKFTMFKPYQRIEPEVPDLSRFIKPIEDDK